jgi:UPF0716 protein FxsA
MPAMARLLLLFILVPVVELALLIEIGSRVGTVPTLVLVLVTGFAGAFLARRQGLGALNDARSQMRRGELPTGPLMDGVLILIAAAFLVTPGVLTDVLGFLLLIGAVRKRIRSAVLSWIQRGIDERRIRVYAAGFDPYAVARGVNPEESGRTPPYKIH